MLLQNKTWGILAALVLLVNIVSGFGIQLFSSGFSISTGMPTMVVFTGNYPKLVTFKIGVINKDNTLTSLEEFNAYNFMAGDFQRVNIPNNIHPGINYYFIAVDNDDSSNYATLGPLVIQETNSGSNPSASITAKSGGVAYKTDGGSIASPTSTFTPTNSRKSNDDNDDHSSPNYFAIVGGVAGGLVILMIIFWIFLYKRCLKRQTLGGFTVTYTNNANNAPSQLNRQSIPIGATIIELSGPKKSGVKPKKAPLSPQKTKQSVRRPDTGGIKNSLPTSSKENTLVPPHPHQQGYPSYPNPQDPNFSGDYMPIPEHFNNTNRPYPPMSPTIQNNMYPPQPQYPIYNPQQGWSPQQYINPFIAGGYPPMAENREDKTTDLSFADKLLADNSNLHGVKTDKEEYQQKPDIVSDAQIAFGKPDDADFNKSHKR